MDELKRINKSVNNDKWRKNTELWKNSLCTGILISRLSRDHTHKCKLAKILGILFSDYTSLITTLLVAWAAHRPYIASVLVKMIAQAELKRSTSGIAVSN